MWARRFATGLSSLRDRAAARLAAFNSSRVTITRVSSRSMTDEDWKHFDAAFDKMDEAFKEFGKIK